MSRRFILVGDEGILLDTRMEIEFFFALMINVVCRTLHPSFVERFRVKLFSFKNAQTELEELLIRRRGNFA